jgi:predicted N-acetyltransferase YhbS
MKKSMTEIEITPAHPEDALEASVLASRAMINLPENIAVFQGHRRRMEAVFKIMFQRMPGQVLLAKDQGQIVGVTRMVEWPHCRQTSPLDKIKLLPSMIKALRSTLPRALKFLSVWEKHDPRKSHWHLDPLAVMPERQGQGIGSQLMKCFCDHLDHLGAAGYLETGTTENVRFYEGFGFSVIGEAPIYGVTTWLMWRSGNTREPI